jgi:hypothetical protein
MRFSVVVARCGPRTGPGEAASQVRDPGRPEARGQAGSRSGGARAELSAAIARTRKML